MTRTAARTGGKQTVLQMFEAFEKLSHAAFSAAWVTVWQLYFAAQLSSAP